jgi:hypothetical protein
MPPRVVVIGAGPMGLAAALGAIERGCETTVLERNEVGASLRMWGPTRFFTPLRMNLSSMMRAVAGDILPADDELLTGPQFADILSELARRDPLRMCIRTKHSVLAVGRRGLTRSDYAGHPLRSERPFRLLIDSPNGEEVMEADVVFDASGGQTIPRPFGADGLPARGELRLNSSVIRTPVSTSSVESGFSSSATATPPPTPSDHSNSWPASSRRHGSRGRFARRIDARVRTWRTIRSQNDNRWSIARTIWRSRLPHF